MSTSPDAAVQIPPAPKERLVSLDVLRGLDLLLLLSLSFMGSLGNTLAEKYPDMSESVTKFFEQFQHVPWEGFSLCDLAMPLFLFMAGAAIPFSMARYRRDDGGMRRWRAWVRVLRRVVVLWIFGMMVQGNLLSLTPSRFKIFSNTLQAIAVGYFFSCLIYLYFPRVTHWVIFAGLLIAFWAANKYITLGEYGGGSYGETTNLAYGIDLKVFGQYRDGVTFNDDGSFTFNPGYTYTWILSSLTFVATSLSGMIAGDALYRTRAKLANGAGVSVKWRAFATIAVAAVICLVLGRVWGRLPETFYAYCPIVKHIWTPTMTLWSSGISLALLAACYLLFDIIKAPKFLSFFFVVLGANSIVAYMTPHIFKVDQISSCLVYGLEQYVGIWYNPTLKFVSFLLTWLLLFDLWRYKRFFRI
ncbi:MAG: DUF5009 domain-containing protein [Planctomycetia bacterium]|nr:DUF5009 domain-containing protein [Planctomycetia bacterium]